MTTYSNPGAIADVITKTKIESTWANAIRDRVISSFASTADRDTFYAGQPGGVPMPGQACWIGTTGLFLVYHGPLVGWGPPWNSKWGHIGSASVASTQGSITTTLDVTSAAVSFVAVPNRRYRVSYRALVRNATAGSHNVIDVTSAGNVVTGTGALTNVNVNDPETLSYEYTETGLAIVTHTRKLRAHCDSGTMAIVGATDATFIEVNDDGPNGNPS